MLTTTEAIVLKSFRYKESSAIVQLYSYNYGRVAAIMNGVYQSSGKKRSRASLLQPMSLIDTELYYKATNNLQRLKSVQASHVLNTVHFNLKKNSIILFIAELLQQVIKEEEQNTILYEFLKNAILILDENDRGIENFHLKFLIELTRFLGFYPQNNFNELNKRFDLRKGYFSTSIDSNYSLSENLSRNLYQLFSFKLSEMASYHISNLDRKQLLEALLDYYYYHIDQMKPLNSVSILHQLFE